VFPLIVWEGVRGCPPGTLQCHSVWIRTCVGETKPQAQVNDTERPKLGLQKRKSQKEPSQRVRTTRYLHYQVCRSEHATGVLLGAPRQSYQGWQVLHEIVTITTPTSEPCPPLDETDTRACNTEPKHTCTLWTRMERWWAGSARRCQ
jgi:hypothetical protein